MTISRRSLLASGGALLAATSLAVPTGAVALEGESGLLIALLAAAAIRDGDKSGVDVRLGDKQLAQANEMKGKDLPMYLAKQVGAGLRNQNKDLPRGLEEQLYMQLSRAKAGTKNIRFKVQGKGDEIWAIDVKLQYK